MPLIEDVNNKLGQHQAKNEYWQSIGEHVVRCKLPYGDYILPPRVVVDTKRDVCELAMDINNDHERFRNAAIKARDMGSAKWILTENEDGIECLADLADWLEPIEHYEMRRRRNPKSQRFCGSRLAKACVTMGHKYGLTFDFCKPEDAGARVLEILKGGADDERIYGDRA